MAFLGLAVLWPVLVIVAILVKVKMPGGPAFFVQKRVGKDGKLFNCHKFRTMRVQSHTDSTDNTEKAISNTNGTNNTNASAGSATAGWSTVSVAGDSRITPLGAKLRHWKLDELPGLWDVLIGNMSFVGPRPDVPGYADKLQGDDRDVLKLRPGITGPATLKYRLEDEYLSNARTLVAQLNENDNHNDNLGVASREISQNLIKNLPKEIDKMSDQELAVWYNDNVIYPDKVRLNCYYYRHYSFIKDIQMIFCTVLGRHMKYGGEII